MPANASPLVALGLCCPRTRGTRPLASRWPSHPRPCLGRAESGSAACSVRGSSVSRRALARSVCQCVRACAVCACVRACACAALTCRLLTEVFVCIQASELRGPPVLPPLPSELRPCLRHLSDLAVFHCLLPTDPAGPPARTCPSLPSPPRPVKLPRVAHGPKNLPSPSGHVAGRPTDGLSARRGGHEGCQACREHRASACATLLQATVCVSVCLFVCLSQSGKDASDRGVQ